MTTYLVADIGGTHARCARAFVEPARGSIRLRQIRQYKCRDFASVDRLLMAYRDELGDELGDGLPSRGCLAVAGPVMGDRITLTNNDWNFSTEQLRRRFGFEQLRVINDLAAVACSTQHIDADELLPIRRGRPQASERRVVLGAGTGLGVASLMIVNGRAHTIASEAGHAAFAPADKNEMQLLDVLQRRHGDVSWETLLSGAGLLRLYEALALMSGRRVEPLRPDEITERAGVGDDALCVETATAFCKLLAGAASDAALWFCAFGGVYLAGDICLSLRNFLSDDFLERFSSKGAMTELLSRVPVSLILHEQPGLLGAAAAAHSLATEQEAGVPAGPS